MRYRDLLIVWGMLAVTPAAPVWAEDASDRVLIKDTPKAVQETIRIEAPNNAKVKIKKHRVGGGELYEVEMTDGYREVEILVDDRGRLVHQDHDPT